MHLNNIKTKTMYKLFSAFAWLMILFVAIVIAVVCFSCTASKSVVITPVSADSMEVHYDVVAADSVILEYSNDGITWRRDTALTQNNAVIRRELREFNRLLIRLNDERFYSKIIRL